VTHSDANAWRGNAFDLRVLRWLAVREHGDLQAWSVLFELRHLLRGDRLHDVVDVHRNAAGMRPEAVVGLFGAEQPLRNLRRAAQERPKFGRLIV
jgi:hypothetical protein